MGYAGLDNWIDSDMAADLVRTVVDKLVKELKKGLKEDHGDYNTGGPENVAMFVEAFIKPNVYTWARTCSEELYQLIDLCKDNMEQLIEDTRKNKDWEDDEDNRKWHLTKYNRMLRNLKYVLQKFEEEY